MGLTELRFFWWGIEIEDGETRVFEGGCVTEFWVFDGCEALAEAEIGVREREGNGGSSCIDIFISSPPRLN